MRKRLIFAFLAGTLVPIGAMLWITASLLQESLNYATTEDLDTLSKSLERTARQLYQRAREDLQEDVAAGRLTPQRFKEAESSTWPAAVRQFRDSGETRRFSIAGAEGDSLQYFTRHGSDVDLYVRSLDGIRMDELLAQFRRARRQIDALSGRDLRRGFTVTLLLLSAGIWLLSLTALTFVAHRISQPIRELTAGLSQLAAGRYETRLPVPRRDEIGKAVQAFNEMAARLENNRGRLIYLTQVASWQLLARKMAHELKNSLTPIRLTVEEIVARQERCDSGFLKQAVQVVVEEIESLERRVRAFSEFSSEPTPQPQAFGVNVVLQERLEFVRRAHDGLVCDFQGGDPSPVAFADPDHVKGIVTNVLANAAEAVAPVGRLLVSSGCCDSKVWVEVHDSGPGLTEEARRCLFEPTISFKKDGMGLGLAISRKNALLAGGDLQPIESRLGGAAFRLLLPAANGLADTPARS